jgi:hypothetical protein
MGTDVEPARVGGRSACGRLNRRVRGSAVYHCRRRYRRRCAGPGDGATAAQRLGYGHRTPDFGGPFDKSRREWDDSRDSIAVPAWAGEDVIAVVNLTWMHKVTTARRIVEAHLPDLNMASPEISTLLHRD